MAHTLPKRLLPFFWHFAQPYKRYLAGLLFAGLFWGIYNSLSPYVLKCIIDAISEFSGDKKEIFSVLEAPVFWYMALWVSIAVNFRLRDWILLKFHPSLRQDIAEAMFAYLNQHSHRFFQDNFAGSLSNKISDMTGGTVSILSKMEDAFANIISVLIAIIAMFLVHPLFGAILFTWAVCFMAISLRLTRHIRHLSNIFAESKTLLMGKIVDSITNIINMRLFARNAYENHHIKETLSDTVKKDQAMQWYVLKMHLWWDVTVIILIGLMLGSLIYLYSQNYITIGDFTFIITIAISIFHSLCYLASEFASFSEEIGKCQQALSIVTIPHEITDSKDAEPLFVSKGEITFENVSFHYVRNNNIFQNQNITITPGSKVGLVGFSGSGKTTFVQLILRFYDIAGGRILIDNQDITKVKQSSLREAIAMIPQDTSLFHRTLMENIRYGRLNASDAEVIAASKQAHCHEFIQQIPEGYQAMVGERGIKLSGGQRQRIAIARAILKNAPILILDEATSALDSVTEKHIQEGLHLLMQGRTTIVIAHRLSTLSEMDRILVFDKGHIIEDGTHESLLKAGGHYARMWHMQAGGFLPEREEEEGA